MATTPSSVLEKLKAALEFVEKLQSENETYRQNFEKVYHNLSVDFIYTRVSQGKK
jgi:uncharacterized protein (UPF0335 family)